MITIVSGTNRKESNTLNVANHISAVLSEKSIENKVLNLEDLPRDFVYTNSTYGDGTNDLSEIISKFIDSTNKYIVIAPEYNGGFPGVLKAFFDAVHPKHFHSIASQSHCSTNHLYSFVLAFRERQ